MQRVRDDDKRGFCHRLYRLVVVKFMAGHKDNKPATKKLVNKESDITIYFKQREDSEDNAKPINVSGSEKERAIRLVNGSNSSKKNLASEPKPLLNDINKQSDAFIESRLQKMRKADNMMGHN